MKRFLVALLFVLSTVFSNAAELISTATSDNSNSGLMFDIRALNATTINAFSFLASSAGTTINVSIYTKTGSHVGFESNAGAWTLLGTVPVTVTGSRQLIPLKFNVAVAAGASQAFYILTTGSIRYAVASPAGVIGTVYGADANLELLSGTGLLNFGEFRFVSRAFTGSVFYGLQPASAVTVVSGTPQSTNISTAFGAPLLVTVTDTGGNPLPGETVTFTAPGGASAALSSATCVTNLNGRCSVTATANGTAGSYNVEASVAGVALPAVFSLTNTTPPSAVTVVSGTPQSTNISTAFGAPLLVTVTDAGNNPLQGETVTFTSPAGASAALSSATCVTNLNGQCSVTATANGTAGSYNVEASVAGVALPAVFALTNTIPMAAAVSIPTLSEWTLIALSVLLAMITAWRMRRSSH